MAYKWIAVFCLFVVAVNCSRIMFPRDSAPDRWDSDVFGPNPDIYAEEPFGDLGRRVYRKTNDVPARPAAVSSKNSDVPTIEDRFAIRGGNCPDGYVLRGGFCFPDYD